MQSLPALKMRAVYAEYHTLMVEEYEPLAHVVRHGGELLAPAVQLLYLGGDLLLLLLHAREQRAELVIDVVAQRVVKVYRVQRADNAL